MTLSDSEMSLSDHVLYGIQRWYQTTMKNLTHSHKPSAATFGTWVEQLPRPVSLSSARSLLERLSHKLQATEERGFVFPARAAIRRRAQDLLHAINCAESRDGVSAVDLVDELLNSSAPLRSNVARHESFSLQTVAQG